MALPTDIAALLKQLENDGNRDTISKLKVAISAHLQAPSQKASPTELPKDDIGAVIAKLEGVSIEANPPSQPGRNYRVYSARLRRL
jgi:hypothetical protein